MEGKGRVKTLAELTWVGSVGHHQHAQGAQVDVSLISVSDQSPVHIPGLDTSYFSYTQTHRTRNIIRTAIMDTYKINIK